MIRRVCVFGLWHLGSVTAAGLAALGFEVIGLDPDPGRIAALGAGEPPVAEPGLSDLIKSSIASGSLTFTTDPKEALRSTDMLWVTFDTPVDEDDRADPGWVRAQVDDLHQYVKPGTVVVVSSQVPVGFTGALERDWGRGFKFACIPENLRLGKAIDAFLHAERMVVGLGAGLEPEHLEPVIARLGAPPLWMSLASAEMTKHALNGFLALCVAYTNELARICERVGADAAEVERGLRTDPRVGAKAYVSAGSAFAGGTLARDIRFLSVLAREHQTSSPLIDAVKISNDLHKDWVRGQLERRLTGITEPRVALLGLTYKPGTDTLRRSSSLELGAWLYARGVRVRGFDPAVRALPPGIDGLDLSSSVEEVLEGADVAVLATPWPEFRGLTAGKLVERMRRPCLVDEAGFLQELATEPRIQYVRVGRP